MGERLGGDGVPGRRRVHPGGAASDPWEVREAATLETELGAVLLGGPLDPEAEQRALTAFGPPMTRARTGRVPGAGTTGGCLRSGVPGVL
ncbi:hypothetical protein O1M63_27500 [Streptomyces mirabilis]|nr:hypothetical protein [Streptomyces mirabilis]